MDRSNSGWPSLHYDDWSQTCATLHLWTQIVGKIRMAKTPPINHGWHVTLYVTSRGLGTSPIPDGNRSFEIDFDFLDHRLRLSTSDGERHEFKLTPMSVAQFYERMRHALADLDIDAKIYGTPSEIEDPISFARDESHASYDADAAQRFWRILVSIQNVFTEFRSRFIGKVSPVHFFWGAFDLAVTRFSGRRAPLHGPAPGLPLAVVQEAYSHEVSSAGFWPGAPGVDAVFYSYAYPEPKGFAQSLIAPAAATWSTQFGEFLLPYEAVRTAPSPAEALMQFLESTYDRAATLAQWPRGELERSTPKS